jgi:hypothetical protein
MAIGRAGLERAASPPAGLAGPECQRPRAKIRGPILSRLGDGLTGKPAANGAAIPRLQLHPAAADLGRDGRHSRA